MSRQVLPTALRGKRSRQHTLVHVSMNCSFPYVTVGLWSRQSMVIWKIFKAKFTYLGQLFYRTINVIITTTTKYWHKYVPSGCWSQDEPRHRQGPSYAQNHPKMSLCRVCCLQYDRRPLQRSSYCCGIYHTPGKNVQCLPPTYSHILKSHRIPFAKVLLLWVHAEK